MRWVLSLRDWRSHAVSETAEDKAVCGHLLVAGASVHDEPFGTPCGLCVALRLASLHAEHLAGALAQLQRLYGVTGRLRALAGEAPGLDLAQLQRRLQALAEVAGEATGALDQELTDLTDTAMARHDQMLAEATPPPAPGGGYPDDRQPSG